MKEMDDKIEANESYLHILFQDFSEIFHGLLATFDCFLCLLPNGRLIILVIFQYITGLYWDIPNNFFCPCLCDNCRNVSDILMK